MPRMKLRLSLVNLNAIKIVEEDRAIILIKLNEITEKLEKYLIKTMKRQFRIKTNNIKITSAIDMIDNELYLGVKLERVKPKQQQQTQQTQQTQQQETQGGETKQ